MTEYLGETELLFKADFSADERRSMARSGQALADGSFPVPDAAHLDKAIHAVGRASNNSGATVRKHIMRRAKALGLSSRIPDTWNADGSLQKSEDVSLNVELWKSDSDHMVYGVVLSPGVEDSQGDIAEPAEIAKAAHRWLAEYRSHDVQHSGQRAPDIVPVESFIAPGDVEIAGQRVLKGAWVLGAKVGDAEWQRVEKGELTGWSIEGSAVREPVPA